MRHTSARSKSLGMNDTAALKRYAYSCRNTDGAGREYLLVIFESVASGIYLFPQVFIKILYLHRLIRSYSNSGGCNSRKMQRKRGRCAVIVGGVRTHVFENRIGKENKRTCAQRRGTVELIEK